MKRMGNLQVLSAGLVAAGLLGLPQADAAIAPPVSTGLVVAIDASDATTSGGFVTSANDQSGNGHHAVGAFGPMLVANATPTGAGVFRFDGDTQYLDIAGSAAFDNTSLTTFIVFQTPEMNASSRITASAYSDINPGLAGDQSHYQVNGMFAAPSSGTNRLNLQGRSVTGGATTVRTDPDTMSVDEFYIGVGVYTAGTGDLAITAIDPLGASSTGTLGGASPGLSGHLFTRIGASGTTSAATLTNYFEGDIAAILIYNRVLDVGERAAVESYLRDAYQVQVPEPASAALLLSAGLAVLARRRAAHD